MENVLTVVARIRAAKGKGDALAALLSEQAGVVRKAEPGCLTYRVQLDDGSPQGAVFLRNVCGRSGIRTSPQGASFRLSPASRIGRIGGRCRSRGDFPFPYRMTNVEQG